MKVGDYVAPRLKYRRHIPEMKEGVKAQPECTVCRQRVPWLEAIYCRSLHRWICFRCGIAVVRAINDLTEAREVSK